MMRTSPTTAERLDHALDRLVSGIDSATAVATAGIREPERTLLDTAARVRSALAVPLPSPRFEAALGARLADLATARPVPWALRHPGRLIVGGAVGSAVGVGVTAYAVWRTTRRSPGPRLLHR